MHELTTILLKSFSFTKPPTVKKHFQGKLLLILYNDCEKFTTKVWKIFDVTLKLKKSAKNIMNKTLTINFFLFKKKNIIEIVVSKHLTHFCLNLYSAIKKRNYSSKNVTLQYAKTIIKLKNQF